MQITNTDLLYKYISILVCISIFSIFVDLEKAFDRIPRDLIWWCLIKKGVPEEYVKIVQDMFRPSKTQVVTQKDETDCFPIEVGLHQGSALSPLLFIIIMDVLT